MTYFEFLDVQYISMATTSILVVGGKRVSVSTSNILTGQFLVKRGEVLIEHILLVDI